MVYGNCLVPPIEHLVGINGSRASSNLVQRVLDKSKKTAILVLNHVGFLPVRD